MGWFEFFYTTFSKNPVEDFHRSILLELFENEVQYTGGATCLKIDARSTLKRSSAQAQGRAWHFASETRVELNLLQVTNFLYKLQGLR